MLEHLIELRRRALYLLACFIALFLLFFFWASELFHAMITPLLATLPARGELIAIQITSPLLTPVKLAGDAAILLSTPFGLYQFWQFISPGLYKAEQKHVKGALILSLLLFAAGLLFCFYLILPFMFQFFAKALPEGVRFMPDMAYTLDFITRMLLLFGLCFQTPLINLILVRLKVIDVETLKKIRPYVIVAAFTIGMLLTPPDVMSQIMLALPLCLLYEVGILLALYFA